MGTKISRLTIMSMALFGCAVMAVQPAMAKTLKLYDVEELLDSVDKAVSEYDTISDQRYLMDHMAMDAKITLRYAKIRRMIIAILLIYQFIQIRRAMGWGMDTNTHMRT